MYRAYTITIGTHAIQPIEDTFFVLAYEEKVVEYITPNIYFKACVLQFSFN